MSETTEPPAMSQQYRWLVVAGGLICLAAMWLPLFGHDRPLVPARDEYGQLSWLWLLLPACALPRTDRGRRWMNTALRSLLVLAGAAGVIALFVLAGGRDSFALVLLPAPVAVMLVGAFGRGVARLTILIALTTLVGCAIMYDDDARYGLAVLATGSGVMLIGAILWSRRPFQGELVAPLPRAVVR